MQDCGAHNRRDEETDPVVEATRFEYSRSSVRAVIVPIIHIARPLLKSTNLSCILSATSRGTHLYQKVQVMCTIKYKYSYCMVQVTGRC